MKFAQVDKKNHQTPHCDANQYAWIVMKANKFASDHFSVLTAQVHRLEGFE
jgi:hypothetical protein